MNIFQDTPLDEVVEKWVPLFYGIVNTAAGTRHNPSVKNLAVFGNESAKSIAAFMAASDPHIERVDLSLVAEVGSLADDFLATETFKPRTVESLKRDLAWQERALQALHADMQHGICPEPARDIVRNLIVPFHAAQGLIDALALVNDTPYKEVQIKALRGTVYPLTDMRSLIETIQWRASADNSPAASL